MEDYGSMEISLLGLDPLQIFDSFGNFKPIPGYQREDRRLFEYGGGLQIPSETFGAILMFDYLLRALIQHAEWIKAEEGELSFVDLSFQDFLLSFLGELGLEPELESELEAAKSFAELEAVESLLDDVAFAEMGFAMRFEPSIIVKS